MQVAHTRNLPLPARGRPLPEFCRPVPEHRYRRLLLALGLVGLAALCGCTAPRTIIPNNAPGIVSPKFAFASLGPGSPAVLMITQNAYANATRQQIFLATAGNTPGENTLRVDIFGVSNKSVGPETILADRPLAESDLAAEFEDALPGVPLRRSQIYVQNAYGPFGYATGKSTQGDACIYAWQRIATPDEDISLFNRRAAISIRLRYCRPGASEAGLAAAMMGLQIRATLSDGSWMPRSQHFSLPFGAPGAPIGPPAVQTKNRSVPPAPQPRHAHRHIAPAPQQTPAPPAAQEPISGPIVPPPPTGGTPTNAPVVPPSSKPGGQP